MPQHQKRLHHSRGKHRKTFYKSYGWEVARVSRALKETNTPFQFLMPGDFPGTPESYKSFSSSVATTATFLIQSDEFSTSQNVGYSLNTSQVMSYPVSMPIDPLNEEVALLVNFLLLKYQIKQPVTKADMMNVAIYKCEVHFPEILRRASECIGMLFGLDLKEVDPFNHCYVLFIKLGLTYDGMMHGEAGVPKTGILILTLGVIFMKGNCATEDEVWEVLNVTRMCSRRKYFFFGELKQLITEDFVREGYLEFRQVASEGPVQSVFLWGPRAHAETTKMKILEFLAKVNGTDPSYFPFKYEEALQDENQKLRPEFQPIVSATASSCIGD